MTTIRIAKSSEAAWLTEQFNARMGWHKPADYFQSVLEKQASCELVLLLAVQNTAYLGHCKIVWQSEYFGFRSKDIPEIQDLNVRPDYRRRGIASRLLDEAESRIAQRTEQAGIGFGLYADYGAAQRLYIKRGYLPDGRGVHYRGEAVVPGESYPLDDDLVLFLVKQL